MLSYGGAKTRRKSFSSHGIQHQLVMGTVNVAMNGPRKQSWKRLARRSSVFIPVGESSSFIPQYKLENAKLPRFMILHFGRPRLIWDWVILVLVCYIAIMVPYNVAFKAHDHRKELIIADCIVELFFVFDIFINFRTTYIDKKSGRIITEKKLIAMHYLKRWFVIDFLAVLPFEALYLIDYSWGFLVSLLKTGRLLRLFRIARRISRYIEYTVSLLGLLMFSFAMLGHWFACIWYVIGYEEFQRKETNGWLYGLGDQMGKPYKNNTLSTGPSKGEAYISSLYFILTSLTTVGFGNIAPNTAAEKIFSVVVLLLGALMQSAIFGNMTAVIQKLYAVRARFHAKAGEIKQFLRLHRIENDLKRRIEDYFLTHWSVSKGVDSDEMLESFPSELRADICLHMYKNFISLSCFADASRGCWRLLSLKVKRAYFGPGELILKERDAIDAIFFVNSGTIEIVQKDCIVAILGSGDIFGDDVSRRFPIRRSNGDVRALTYCDLLYLSRENFFGVIHLYPDFADAFSHKLEMTFNLGMRDRDASTCGPLDSITEGDEEEEADLSESAENDSTEEPSFSRDGSIASPSSPTLPLWQRRLRGLDEETRQSPTLEERLLRISFDSNSSDSEDNDSKTNLILENENKSCLLPSSFEKSTKIDGIEIASNLSLCSNGDFTKIHRKASENSINIRETSFLGDSPDERTYLSSIARADLNCTYQTSIRDLSDIDSGKEKDIESSNNSQTLLIYKHESDLTSVESLLDVVDTNENEIKTDNFVAENTHILTDCGHIELLKNRTITRNPELNTLPRSKYGKRQCRKRNSLPNMFDKVPLRSKHNKNNEIVHVRRTSSFANANARQKETGISKNPKLVFGNSFDAFELLPSDCFGEKDEYLENENTTLVDEKLRSSAEMSWDMMCTSFQNQQSSPESTLLSDNDTKKMGISGGLQLPKHQIERLSSGVFSQDFLDSDSESSCTGDVIHCDRSYKIDSPVSNYSTRGDQIEKRPSFQTRKRKSNVMEIGASLTTMFDSVSRSELLHAELLKGNQRNLRSAESSEKAFLTSQDGHSLSNLGCLAKDLSQSKEVINGMSLKLEQLSDDVIGLKKEVHSLTALVRIMIERQDSLR